MWVSGPPFPPMLQSGVSMRAATSLPIQPLTQKHRPLPSIFQLGEREGSRHNLPPACVGLITDTGQTWQLNIKQIPISHRKAMLKSPQIQLLRQRVTVPSSGWLTLRQPHQHFKKTKGQVHVGVCNEVKWADTPSHTCCIEIGKDRHTQ